MFVPHNSRASRPEVGVRWPHIHPPATHLSRKTFCHWSRRKLSCWLPSGCAGSGVRRTPVTAPEWSPFSSSLEAPRPHRPDPCWRRAACPTAGTAEHSPKPLTPKHSGSATSRRGQVRSTHPLSPARRLCLQDRSNCLRRPPYCC